MKNLWITFIIFISMICLQSCKKELSDKISGDYYFVTTARYVDALPTNIDTTIYYYGSISRESEHSVKIVYAQQLPKGSQFWVWGTIHPSINNNWTFSYPDFTTNSNGDNDFYGEIYNNGTIHIFTGYGSLVQDMVTT
jgi:hypothetical protein